jgi:hypothetical protein
MGQEMVQDGEDVRAETTFRPISFPKRVILEEINEEALGQVLRFGKLVAAYANVIENRAPVYFAKPA